MKVAFMASDAVAIKSIEAVAASQELELACIVSNPDKPKGRGKKLSPNDVSAWAIANSVELLRPEKSPDETVSARLRELGVELIVVMAYGKMLKKNILEYGKYPCLNLHASLLPDLRGASPIETAIALGYKKTGVSLMAIEAKMDAGAVCATGDVEIESADTSKSLREKIAHAAAKLLLDNVRSIIGGTAVFMRQDEALATYARKIAKEDLLINFNLHAAEIVNRTRAFSCGIFEFENEKYKVCAASVADRLKTLASCGEIVQASAEAGLRIACKDSDVVFKMIQKPCAKMMCAADFFAGNSFPIGIILKSFESLPLIRK